MKNQHLNEQAFEQALLDKSIAQSRFEIVSDILHDIGNAIVGFGSYLNRMRRSAEQNNLENLHKLAGFLAGQQALLATVLGEAKAEALVKMLNSIAETQLQQQEEFRNSVAELINIVSHMQEILNIQRQYVQGCEQQEKMTVSVRNLVNDCLSMLSASMDKRGIMISRDIPETLPVLKGDRTRLMQVVLNVLKNSIEAINMQAAEKKICVRLSSVPDLVILEVQDNGTGFDESTAARLFTRGFTTKSSGTGLGLASCRSIVEKHAGTFNIVSPGPGRGALVTITFNVNTYRDSPKA